MDFILPWPFPRVINPYIVIPCNPKDYIFSCGLKPIILQTPTRHVQLVHHFVDILAGNGAGWHEDCAPTELFGAKTMLQDFACTSTNQYNILYSILHNNTV